MISHFKTELESLRYNKVANKFPQNDKEWINKFWYESAIKYTKGKSAPRVEKNIVEFLNLKGHQAEKRSVTGRLMKGKDIQTSIGTLVGKTKYIPSTGTKGASDISAVIYGLSIAIEVKLGRDTQSKAQKEYEQAIKKAGGIYFIAKDEDDFFIKYNELMDNPTIQLLKGFKM